ncbi:MAG: acylphosphatase [candidate division WOR-3 bacterium]
MEKRAEIIVKGEVQRVGFRDRVEKIARRMNVKGFVENLKPYDVRIIAEADEEILKKFIKEIEIKKPPILVESIEVKVSPPTGEFSFFEIKRGEWQEELGERLDTAGNLLYRVVELGEKSVELGEKSVALGEKAVALGEKSVALGEKSVALGEKSVALGEKSVALGEKSVALGEKSVALGEENLKIGRQMLEKQDKTIEEIKGMREDLKSYMDRRFQQLEYEIMKIKEHIGIE